MAKKNDEERKRPDIGSITEVLFIKRSKTLATTTYTISEKVEILVPPPNYQFFVANSHCHVYQTSEKDICNPVELPHFKLKDLKEDNPFVTVSPILSEEVLPTTQTRPLDLSMKSKKPLNLSMKN